MNSLLGGIGNALMNMNKVGTAPAPMMAVYDYLHDKYIDEAKEVKVMQQMYMEK